MLRGDELFVHPLIDSIDTFILGTYFPRGSSYPEEEPFRQTNRRHTDQLRLTRFKGFDAVQHSAIGQLVK